jgi:glycosyl transferase/beta-hydroxylase protein BlmF
MTPQEEWQKKVRRILTDPDGRAALKTFGINVELAGEQKPDDKPVVVILCPTYRAPDPQMRDALSAMVRYTHESGVASVYSGPPLQSSVIHWSRNGLFTEQLKSGKPWTHALLIDDDMVVEPDYLVRLLAHKKDIVAGLCTRRQDPPIPNIRLYSEETGKYEQIWEWPENTLIGDHKRLGVGTAFMLCTSHAIEQIGQAYFDCLYEKEYYGVSDEWVAKHRAERLKAFDDGKVCYWFNFLWALQQPIQMGEDIGFCFFASHYCDISVFVDTSIQPGHIGSYPFAIRDFEPYRDQCILKAKLAGTYPMNVPPMKISILCPTRGRPENVKRLLDSIEATATIMPEVVFYVDIDDPTFPQALPFPDTRTIRGERILMSKMWERCAETATGDILMMGGDDLIFQTKGWDDQVKRAFAAFPDRLVFVHGDDKLHGANFGTHGFLHRKWVEATGYFCPPYFSSDYNDTWWNDVANALDRRIYLPFVTEHMHPLAGKAEWDKTHRERLERQKEQNSAKLYAELLPERLADIQKLRNAIHGQSLPARQPQLAAV